MDWHAAKKFLEEQYVEEAGLLKAAKIVYPDSETIWIASDNLLASRALEVLGSTLARRIRVILDERYDGGWNGKHDILLLKRVRRPRDSVIYNLGRVAGYTIKWERADGPALDDWMEYADWIVLMALNDILRGDIMEATSLYEGLLGMWDGYGFKDKAWRVKGEYDVYKLALAVYLHRALNYCGYTRLDWEAYRKWFKIIAGAQRLDGGFRTGYTVIGGDIVYKGDANTETTSIIVLALHSDYPRNLCENTRY